jgi:hypothetical protein
MAQRFNVLQKRVARASENIMATDPVLGDER